MPNTDFIDKIVAKEAYQDIEKTNSLLDVLFEKFVKVAQAANDANAAIGSAKGMKELSTETKKLNEENDELAKISKQIEATIAKRTAAESKLAQELAKEKVLLQQVNKENTNAAKIALTNAGSLSRISAVIEKLQAKQRALNLATEEGAKKSELYKKAIDRLSEARKKESDSIERQRLNIGNYQGSAKIIVDALERARLKTEQVTRQFGELSPEAQAARREMEGLQRITDQPQFLNVAAKVGDTTKELRFFQKELVKMQDAGLQNTQTYKEVEKRLAEVTDQIADTREEIKALSSDTRGFDLFAGSVTFAADAFQTFAGAAQLAGASEEDAAKATATLVAVQSVANGVKGIATELTTKGTAANKVYAFTQGLVATAFDKSAASAKRFYAALGIIGLIVTVIGAVALALGQLNKKLSESEEKQRNLNQIIKESAGDYAKAKIEVEKMGKQIELAKKGIISQEVALKSWNEGMGKTIGQTKKLSEVESLYNEKKDVYIQAMFLKAQAAAGFALTQKLAQESLENEVATTEELLTTWDKVKSFFKGLGSPGGALRSSLSQFESGEENRAKNRIDLQTKTNNVKNQTLLLEEKLAQFYKDNNLASDEQAEIDAEKRKKAEEARKKTEADAQKRKDDQKKIDDDLKKFKTKLASDESKASVDIDNEKNQRLIDNMERVVENEKLALDERLIANALFYTAKENLIKEKAKQEQDAILKTAFEEAESILKRKLDAKKDADLILQIYKLTEKQREEIEQKAQSEILKNRQEGLEKQATITQQEGDRQISILAKIAQEKLNSLNLQEQEELLVLEKNRAKGLITEEQYQNKRAAIEAKYERQRLLDELNLAEKTLKILEATGVDIVAAQQKVADLRLAIEKNTTDQIIAENQKRTDDDKAYVEKKKELFTNLRNELANTVFTFIDIGLEKQKNGLEQEKNMIEERKQRELERISRLQESEEQKAARVKILEAQSENQKRLIEQRQKQISIKQAQFEKLRAAFDIGINTSVGIAKAVAQSPLTGGMPFAAIVAAIGALQLASVLARPVPQYYTGTEDSKGGVVWLGERGKELLITPDKKMYETPDTATLANIPAHSKVINNDDYMAMMRSENLNATIKTKPNDLLSLQMKQAEIETQKIVDASIKIVDAIKNSPRTIVKVAPSGIEHFEAHGSSWLRYLDKSVRFKK